jgi:acetyltransferase-like isoleucine patch superfamily enzyme
MTIPVILPHQNPNDSVATLVQWLVAAGRFVQQGQPIAVFETTKAAFEIEAPAAGWLIVRAQIGSMIDVGKAFAELAPEPPGAAKETVVERRDRKITAKARALMEKYQIDETRLSVDLSLVRERDVLSLIDPVPPALLTDVDEVLKRADYRALMDLLGVLRQRMKSKWSRHVPTGTLLNDRWKLAEGLDSGPEASIYDECLILGDVKIGAHCWVGPYTVLDGSKGRLEIGDWTSIGAGTHAYTHHTIDVALSGGNAKPFGAPTKVGRCCFISPMVMIAPGSDIGDHSFVATFSYVEGRYPPYSCIAGTPARVIGTVEIRNGRVTRNVFDKRSGDMKD